MLERRQTEQQLRVVVPTIVNKVKDPGPKLLESHKRNDFNELAVLQGQVADGSHQGHDEVVIRWIVERRRLKLLLGVWRV